MQNMKNIKIKNDKVENDNLFYLNKNKIFLYINLNYLL